MITAVIVLHVIVCFVLILVILLQAGRGQGLTGPSFGSGNVQSLFGTGAADFLTKATSISAIFFIVTCITLNYVETKRSRSLMEFGRGPQMDLNSIQKALEQVKKEAASKGTAAAVETKAAATENVQSTQSAVTTAVPASTDKPATVPATTAQAAPTDQAPKPAKP